MTALHQWMDDNDARDAAARQSQADTAKLIATFASGVAAAVVASALQTGRSNNWDRVSAGLLAFSVVLAVVVALVDRREGADVDRVLRDSISQGWDADTLLANLRSEANRVISVNRDVLSRVRRWLAFQLLVAAAAGATAAVALLMGEPG